jgi:hypothetical protein
MIKPAERIYQPCCGPFAAFLAGKEDDFDVVFNKAKEKFNRGGNWKGRMYWLEVVSLLNLVGVKTKDANNLLGLTVRRAGLEHTTPGVIYVVRIAGHFLVLRNGLAYDQGNPLGKPVEEYFGRRRRITHAVEVLP